MGMKFVTIKREFDPDNEIAIKTAKVAGYLIMKNCKCVNIAPDLKDSKRDIYFFVKDKKLNKALSQYNEYKDTVSSIAYSDLRGGHDEQI